MKKTYDFRLSCYLAWPRDQRVQYFSAWELLKKSSHPVKFSGHRHPSSGDMFIAFHVILQDHVIQGPCDLYGWQPHIVSHHTGTTGGHRHSGSGDMFYGLKGKVPHVLVLIGHYCLSLKHMTWKHMTRWSHTFWVPNDETFAKKTFASPLLKHQRDGKGEKNYKKGIAKLFALHANTETNEINTFNWRSLKGIQFMQNIKAINISQYAVCLIEKNHNIFW